jgi:hypothetical protein
MALTTLTRAKFDEYLMLSFLNFLQAQLGATYEVRHWMPELGQANALVPIFAAGKKAVIAVTIPESFSRKERARFRHYYDGTLAVGHAFYNKKQVATGETLLGDFQLNVACKSNEAPNSGLRDLLQTMGALKAIFAAADSTPVYDFDGAANTSLTIQWNFDDERNPIRFTTLPLPASEYQNGAVTIPFAVDYYVLATQDVVTERAIVPDKRQS